MNKIIDITLSDIMTNGSITWDHLQRAHVRLTENEEPSFLISGMHGRSDFDIYEAAYRAFLDADDEPVNV